MNKNKISNFADSTTSPLPHHSILLILTSAVLLGLTRLSVKLDMLSFVAFIPLFYYFTKQHNNKKRFLHGILFSSVYLLISIHWISIVTMGGFIGILVLFGAIFGGIFCLMNLLKPNTSRYWIYNPLFFICIWLSFEFLTNFTEFSYPWFCIAYGLKNSLPFLQILDIGGMTLVGLFILLINYLFYKGITDNFNRRYFYMSFSFLIIWFVFGNLRIMQINNMAQVQDFKISMIQGSIRQELKFEDTMLDSTFVIYEELSRQAVKKDNPNLIIFPESALPTYLYIWRENYYRLMTLVLELNKPIFTGFLDAEEGVKHSGQLSPFLYYNAANLFTPDTHTFQRYYKNILVPFGERFPFLHYIPILWKADFGQANFERGESSVIYNIMSNNKNYKFAPLICFEIAFPYYLRKNDKEHKIDFWVNITNDAWFEKSIGTHQHAVMASFRTIETRTPVFRTANTGYTFYTTPDGKIQQMTDLFDTTFVTGNLSTYNKTTIFVKYGYLLPYIFILGTIYLLIMTRRKL